METKLANARVLLLEAETQKSEHIRKSVEAVLEQAKEECRQVEEKQNEADEQGSKVEEKQNRVEDAIEVEEQGSKVEEKQNEVEDAKEVEEQGSKVEEKQNEVEDAKEVEEQVSKVEEKQNEVEDAIEVEEQGSKIEEKQNEVEDAIEVEEQGSKVEEKQNEVEDSGAFSGLDFSRVSFLQDKMHFDDDSDYEDDDAEFLEHETATLALLRGKNLIVKNSDGTLRCPLSPSRKKQAYAYSDLLQHATAVASGKRGPEAAGKHSALKKSLETFLSSFSTPPLERLLKVEHNLPRRRPAEDMLVCPWSVVIYNIDNTRDPTKPEIPVGLGKSELKLYFQDFKPVKLKVCWGPEGHLGMCVLQFGRDLSGLKDAQALEKSFLDEEHGLRQYERHLASGDLGQEFYGWLAREADYNGRRCGQRGEEIGKCLRKKGDLKDLEIYGDELKRMHDQQVRQLAATVLEKSKESEDLKTEMEILRRRAEAERLQLEESHKPELQAVRVKAKTSEEDYNQSNLETIQALEKRETELRQLEKDLRKKEFHINSAAKTNRLQAEMMENRQLREALVNQQVLLQHKEAEKIKLFQKHKEETLRLAERAKEEAQKLAKRQQTEMEKEQLQTMLEVGKLFDELTIKGEVIHID